VTKLVNFEFMNQSNSFVEHSSSMNFLQTHSICQSSCKVNSLYQKSFLCSQLDLFHTLRPQAFPFTSQTSPPVTPLTSSSSQTQVTILNMQHRFIVLLPVLYALPFLHSRCTVASLHVKYETLQCLYNPLESLKISMHNSTVCICAHYDKTQWVTIDSRDGMYGFKIAYT